MKLLLSKESHEFPTAVEDALKWHFIFHFVYFVKGALTDSFTFSSASSSTSPLAYAVCLIKLTACLEDWTRVFQLFILQF